MPSWPSGFTLSPVRNSLPNSTLAFAAPDTSSGLLPKSCRFSRLCHRSSGCGRRWRGRVPRTRVRVGISGDTPRACGGAALASSSRYPLRSPPPWLRRGAKAPRGPWRPRPSLPTDTHSRAQRLTSRSCFDSDAEPTPCDALVAWLLPALENPRQLARRLCAASGRGTSRGITRVARASSAPASRRWRCGRGTEEALSRPPPPRRSVPAMITLVARPETCS